jgi:hypothetical protein
VARADAGSGRVAQQGASINRGGSDGRADQAGGTGEAGEAGEAGGAFSPSSAAQEDFSGPTC